MADCAPPLYEGHFEECKRTEGLAVCSMVPANAGDAKIETKQVCAMNKRPEYDALLATFFSLVLVVLVGGCPLQGLGYAPARMPATAPTRYDVWEAVAMSSAAASQPRATEVEVMAGDEGQVHESRSKAVNIDDLRKFVLDNSNLDGPTVDALIASDERYLALIGAIDWPVGYDSEARLELERSRLHIAGPRAGEPPEYTEDGLARVAAESGVTAEAVTVFYELHTQFLQDAGLTGP